MKECWEEAGIPEALARAARPVGLVSYVSLQPEGLKPDVLFCYDLELPPDFVPTPQDGEVSEFVLWDAAAVAACIARGGAVAAASKPVKLVAPYMRSPRSECTRQSTFTNINTALCAAPTTHAARTLSGAWTRDAHPGIS